MPTLTLKMPKLLKIMIAASAKQRGVTQSELVRVAIESYLREPRPTSPKYELIRDIIERLPKNNSLPRDLSTNPKYMEGFGLPGPEYRELLKKEKRHERRRRSR